MPPRYDTASISDEPPTIEAQLQTLIQIYTTRNARLDNLITLMATNTEKIATMFNIIPPRPPPPPPNQQPKPPTTLPSPPPPAPPLQLVKLKPLPPPNQQTRPPTTTLSSQPPPPPLQSTLSPKPPLTSSQPPPPTVTFEQVRPVMLTFQPFAQHFFALVALRTPLSNFNDDFNFTGGGTHTVLVWYLRPPPWPDPFIHGYDAIATEDHHNIGLEDKAIF